ncbi:Conserved_hypothetical protein [Hexamita inflata]|uniref:Uncharacterized protein n=1 Tax=Hexamita inflata TaxID=28002 RepID=A0AA86V103_9EUKA|nr:Conserved hypothetical protein [Hexamita inflata]
MTDDIQFKVNALLQREFQKIIQARNQNKAKTETSVQETTPSKIKQIINDTKQANRIIQQDQHQIAQSVLNEDEQQEHLFRKQDQNRLSKAEQQRTIVLQNKFTQIYKAGLHQMLGQDSLDKSPKELCQIIQQLNIDQQNIFWQFVQSNLSPQCTKLQVKSYYQKSYQQVMYTDSLTEADKQEIRNIISQKLNQLTPQKQMVYLVKNQFKNRNIFPQQIVNYIKNMKYLTKQQNIKQAIQNKEINIFSQPVHNVLSQNNQSLKTYDQIFKPKLIKHTYKINKICMQYIVQFVQKHNNLSVQSTASFLLSSNYFKGKDISKQQLSEIIIQKKLQLQKTINNVKQPRLETQVISNTEQIQSQIFNAGNNTVKKKQLNFKEQSQQLRNYYTILYKQSLNQVLQENFSNKLEPEIYQTITNLDSTQSQQFWNNLVSLVEPQRSVSYLMFYFKQSYQRVQFTQILNKNDRQEIQNTIQSNSTLTQQQIQELLIQQFSNRDICPKDIKKYLSKNYKKFQK